MPVTPKEVYKSSQAARDKASAWYYANKEHVAAKNKAYRVIIRAMIIKARDVPCMDCGHRYPQVCMQFHHRDPSTKKCEIANASTPNLAQKEMAKCDVICANCHCIRHGEDNEL